MDTDNLVALGSPICVYSRDGARKTRRKTPRSTGEINCENSTHMQYQIYTLLANRLHHPCFPMQINQSNDLRLMGCYINYNSTLFKLVARCFYKVTKQTNMVLVNLFA